MVESHLFSNPFEYHIMFYVSFKLYHVGAPILLGALFCCVYYISQKACRCLQTYG